VRGRHWAPGRVVDREVGPAPSRRGRFHVGPAHGRRRGRRVNAPVPAAPCAGGEAAGDAAGVSAWAGSGGGGSGRSAGGPGVRLPRGTHDVSVSVSEEWF